MRERKGPDEPRNHLWVWLVYAALFGAAIPWYLPPEAARVTWLGFPLWVTLSLAFTVAIAGFTVFVIERYWAEPEDE